MKASTHERVLTKQLINGKSGQLKRLRVTDTNR